MEAVPRNLEGPRDWFSMMARSREVPTTLSSICGGGWEGVSGCCGREERRGAKKEGIRKKRQKKQNYSQPVFPPFLYVH